MKRKEFYQIGRLLYILGFLFLAVEAVWNPLVNEKKTGSVYALLADWKILIPVGLFLMGITARRWFDLYCMVVSLLGIAFFVTLTGNVENRFTAVFMWVWESLVIGENYQTRLIPLILATALWFSLIPVAVHRMMRVKRWKVFRIVTSVLLLLLWAFFVFNVAGVLYNGDALSQLDKWVSEQYGLELCIKHGEKVYTVLGIITAAVALVECAEEIILRRAGEFRIETGNSAPEKQESASGEENV